MAQLKHFTVIEGDNYSECPMIGTFDNITNDEIGIQSFKERLLTALSEHYDMIEDCINFENFPELFVGTSFEDMTVMIESIPHRIRIMETWIY